jgi:hypothetical protein
LETQSVLLSPLRKSFQLGITYAALWEDLKWNAA